MSNTGQQTLDMISSYLQPFRDSAEMSKVAAEQSYQDNSANNVSGNNSKNAKDTQTNLGPEQSKDAQDAGSTVENETDNNDSMGSAPTDDQGTVTMDVDQPVTSKGNIGAIQTQKTASEQARVSGLANAILSKLSAEPIQKQASVAPVAAPVSSMEKVAAYAAVEYHESFLAGMQARQRDEADLQKSASHQLEINAQGGVSALLDKIAMEDPMAVLPPEALEGMEAPMDEAPMDEAPMDSPVEAPMGDEAPSDSELEEIAAALAEADVAPEDIEQAISDLQELEAAGVDPQDLAQALSEGAGEAAPVADAGGEVEKVAANCNRENVEAIKAFIFRK
jgi:hypothetical protein